MGIIAFIRNIKGDKVIWMVVFFLAILSLLAVYSSTGTLAYRYQHGNTEYYLFKHLSILLFGLVLMYFAQRIPYTWYGKYSFVALFIAIPLLAYTALFGTSVNDANRWTTLPIINLSFQPSDFGKLAIIIYLSRVLGKHQDYLQSFKFNLTFLIVPMLLVVGLIMPANFSTAAIIFASSMVIMFIGRVNTKHLLGLGAIALVAIGLLILVIKSNPHLGRVETWENRLENFRGENPDGAYQSDQAKIAIASGGIFGKQPGNSMQKNFLPQPYSDFIYAIIIEEYGLLGGIAIVFLYLILLFRGIHIATRCDSTFGSILTFGISFSLVMQAMINMLVVAGLLPVTGQPLPMISMGGTSLWFTSIAIGIVLSVSRTLETNQQTLEYAEA